MITDNALRLSGSLTAVASSSAGTADANTGQAITATAISTNVVDLSQAREIGEGDDVYAVFTVGSVNFNLLTSIAFTIEVSAVEALTSATVVASIPAVLLASLTAKAQFVVRLSPVIASLGLRYLGARYTVAGTSATAGTITCDIVTDIQDGKKYYPSGFTVA